MIRPAIHTMVWKRPEITALHFENISQLNCPVFVGVSEQWAADLCEQYGFEYIMIDNLPLGEKKIRTLELGFRSNKRWTHLIELGSDDFFHPTNMSALLNYGYDKGYDVWGVNQMYVLSEDGKKAMYLAYSPSNKIKVLGAGRIIKRTVLHHLHPLWKADRNKGLDTVSAYKLLDNEYSIEVFLTPEPIILDVKGKENIWSYAKLHKSIQNRTEEVSVETALSVISPQLRDKIKKLKNIPQ